MLMLKNKFNSTDISSDDKIQILTLSPLGIEETIDYFECSKYLVNKSRALRKQYGILPVIPHCSKGRVLTASVMEEVKNFYQDDDISRIMPGKSNCISLRNVDGNKYYEPKRLILGNLKEIYAIYKERRHTNIGFSTFCKLRPKQCVIAGSSGTHSVCVCTHHQNPILMVGALGKKDLDIFSLLKKAVCNTDSPKCMLNQCRDCPGKTGVINYILSLEEVQCMDTISYSKWTSTDRSILESHSSSIDDYIDLLSDSIIKLTKHHYVSKTQSKYLMTLKERISSHEVIIIGDFSENYKFVIQDATQGFHWVNEQATLHPFVIYYKDGRKLKHKSYCFISDYLTHNTTVVYCFQETLIKELKATMPFVKKIFYFSDGCIGQYKNRKNFCNITYHEQDFGLKAEWNFFATSHGKSACDGIGAVIKRAAYKASLQRSVSNHILTPNDLFKFAAKEVTGIKIFFTSTESICITSKKLDKRFSNTQTVKGTHSFHKIIPINVNVFNAFIISDSNTYITCRVTESISSALITVFNIGDYVECSYEDKVYIGLLTDYSEENNDYKVSFLQMNSKIPSHCFFPEREDTCWVKPANILRKLTAPNIVPGIKIVYAFSIKEINALLRKK